MEREAPDCLNVGKGDGMAEWKNLTLFVDESGTFEDDREPWIVGGVLVAEDPVAADALIHARLHERWPAVVEASSQLHMTDLSKRLGPTEATAFASDLLAAPAFLALVESGWKKS